LENEVIIFLSYRTKKPATRAGFREYTLKVPHIGILSNQFIEDLDLIYKLKTILKLNKPFKINL